MVKSQPILRGRTEGIHFRSQTEPHPTKKGKFLASTKFNGQKFEAVGDTEQQATQALHAFIEKQTMDGKIVTH